LIRTTINERYHIIEELGQGGMGTVYRALDTVLQREVAVKFMSGAEIGTEGRARLLSEARIVAQLDHPNIVSVYDAGEYQGSPYIVMQLVEGGTLRQKEPESLEEILHITRQVCEGLEHAHGHGVVHRDLKPENVALTEDGMTKLMDFGLALSMSSRMTRQGEIMGTVFYMAPEQAMGQELDARADLYALGIMLYELTTGQLPFEDENPIAVITQHLNAPVVPPRALNEDLPGYLENLILKLLEKDPQDRPESAGAVLQILESPEKLGAPLREGKQLTVLDRIVRGRIVGRKEEYEQARDLWQLAAAGAGQTLLISGEPGVGKTRLMREIVTQAEVSGGRALVGEAYAESVTPYGAFAQVVRKALDVQSPNGFELPDFVLDDVLNLTPDLRPYYPHVASNPELDPESKQMRLFENMVTFCGALGEESPLLLVLEDAHWADSGSIALFQHLTRRIRKQPVMLLATYREVELSEARPFYEMLLELNRQRIGTRLKLNRLNKEGTRAMLEAIFNEEITPEFLEGIYHETDGNPFFIEEVCRALVESGKLYYAEGEWHRPDMEELEIPQGIQVAVESRLTRLPQEVQDTLRVAAILGREFDYEVLVEASEQDEDIVINAIEEADRVQMVQEGREETIYEFVHALVPQSIRENTHRLRRRRLHRRAASAYEAVQPGNYEALAYHFGEGGNDERALHYYTLAGERALANFANQDAENHLIAALNLTEEEGQRAELLAQLGEAQVRLSRHKEAIQNYGQAIDIFLEQGDQDRAAQIYALSARAAWSSGDTREGLEICRRGLAAVEGSAESPGLAHLLSETARACYFNGVMAEVEGYAKRALEMAAQYDLPAVQAECLNTLGTLLGPGSSESVPMLEEAVRISETANLSKEAMRANNNLGVLYSNQGEYKAAIRHYQRAIELARQMGDAELELFFSANDLWSRVFLGRLQEAEERLAGPGELIEMLPDPGAGGRTLRSFKAFLLLTKGEFKSSLQLLGTVIQEDRKANDLHSLRNALVFKALLLVTIGEDKQVEEVLQEALEVAETLGVGVFQNCVASWVASRRGQVDRARGYLETARQIIGDSQPVFWRGINIAQAEAHLSAAEGDWRAAWEKYHQLMTSLEEKKIRWHTAWYAADWAELILLRSEAEMMPRAKELLERVRSEFDAMGAHGWVKWVDEKLAGIEAGG
jgi:tetratricopeptide (TPR) repeat protein